MPGSRAVSVFTTLGFLTMIACAGVVQTAVELGHGERPRVLEVFDRLPTAANLHEYEHSLEEASLVANRLRPLMQSARFQLLADAGEKALVGRGGWLFYRPGVRYVTGRPVGQPVRHATDPVAAIRSFRDQLAGRGIRLLVVPAPNKESVYPDRLSSRAEGVPGIVCDSTRALLDQLRAAGVEVVDLFEEFRRARQNHSAFGSTDLYLARDSHWSPRGMQIAAVAVARRLEELGWVRREAIAYRTRPVRVQRTGDVLQMLRNPRLEQTIGPDDVDCLQVIDSSGRAYHDAPDARVLVLGDSFLRIYEQDEPGSAGFVAHLSHALGQPMTALVSDGGASTLVRQELYRRPRLLAGKAVVVWEFVERDIRDGAEGWQIIPLPPVPSDRR